MEWSFPVINGMRYLFWKSNTIGDIEVRDSTYEKWFQKNGFRINLSDTPDFGIIYR